MGREWTLGQGTAGEVCGGVALGDVVTQQVTKWTVCCATRPWGHRIQSPTLAWGWGGEGSSFIACDVARGHSAKARLSRDAGVPAHGHSPEAAAHSQAGRELSGREV